MEQQHPLFIKYTRDWLHRVTGYTKGYLCRLATGKVPLSRSFINACCFKLGEPEEALFLPQVAQAKFDSYDCGTEDPSGVGQWLEERCKSEHLTLRQAAAKTGLSHNTIRDILNGVHPHPETIRKLAVAFAGDGNERLALEDHLLVLAGYRTPRPEGEEPTELLARLIDKLGKFSERQLEVMNHFADFLTEIEGK